MRLLCHAICLVLLANPTFTTVMGSNLGCAARADLRSKIENVVWECAWPPAQRGCKWMIHKANNLGPDVSLGAMMDVYSMEYSPSERRRMIVWDRNGHATHQTVIAPDGLTGYYHVPARQGLKDNTVIHLDPCTCTLVMLNPWLDKGLTNTFLVCNRSP